MAPGALAVFEGDLAVDDGSTLYPSRPLHSPPLAARKVVRRPRRPSRASHPGSLVVDDDVGRSAFAERAAIAEAGSMGGQGAEADSGPLRA